MQSFRASTLANGQASSAPPQALASHDTAVAAEIHLTVPLAGPRGAIDVLTIREATLADYIDCGPIVRNIAMNPNDDATLRVEVIEDNDRLMIWMCQLTGQPEAVLRTMRPRDFAAVKREIMAIIAEFSEGNSPSVRTSSSSS